MTAHEAQATQLAPDIYKGKHVALVYQYMPPSNMRKHWYHIWKLDVISFFGFGFESLGCHVRYIDLPSFIQNNQNTFSEMDYALNLICGNWNINTWLIVPSLSDWHGVKSLPGSGDAQLAGERKDLANLIASSVGLQCPETNIFLDAINSKSGKYVIKPRDLGSSVGVFVGSKKYVQKEAKKVLLPHFFQEFVVGIDVTVPVIYDPTCNNYRCGQAIALIPENKNFEWTYDEQSKTSIQRENNIDNVNRLFFNPPESLKSKCIRLVTEVGNTSIARVDFRVKMQNSTENSLKNENLYYFIEVNPFPTMYDHSGYVSGISKSVDGMALFEEKFIEKIKTISCPGKLINALIAYSMLYFADATSKRSELSETILFDG